MFKLTLKDIIGSEVTFFFLVWVPHSLRVLSPFNFSKTIHLATERHVAYEKDFFLIRNLKTVQLGIPHVMTETAILTIVLRSSIEGESPPWAQGGAQPLFSFLSIQEAYALPQTASVKDGKERVSL